MSYELDVVVMECPGPGVPPPVPACAYTREPKGLPARVYVREDVVALEGV